MPRIWCALGAACSLAVVGPLHGQERPPPFSEIGAYLGVAHDASGDDLGDRWSRRPGLHAHLSTPFHRGIFELGVQHTPHEAREGDLPDFGATLGYLGWRVGHALPLGIEARAGPDVGVFLMRFSREGTPVRNNQETELALGATGSLRRSLGSGWSVVLSARHQHVFTSKRIDQTTVELGVGRSFRAPSWLRTFLAGPTRDPRGGIAPASRKSRRTEMPGGDTRPVQTAHGTVRPELEGLTPRAAAGVRVITADELRQAGLRRLSDVLQLVEAWDVTTVDDFTWLVHARASSPYDADGWTVMVDGLEVEADALVPSSLDRLPVALNDLERVEVITTPARYHGRIRLGGVLNFRTSSEGKGPSLTARGMTGSETGDPGPYLFTGEGGRGIARTGNERSLTVGYGTGALRLAGGAVLRRHFPKGLDPIVPRQSGTGPPPIDVSALSARATARLGGRTHQGFVGHSTSDDFTYLSAAGGATIPLATELSYAGVSGAFGLGPGLEIRYRGVAHETRGGPRDDYQLPPEAAWRSRLASAGIELVRATPTRVLAVSSSLDHRTTVLDGGHRRIEDDVLRLLAGSTWLFGDDVSVTADGEVSRSGSGSALAGLLTGSWTPSEVRTLRATLAYGRRLREDRTGLWRWQREGHPFLESLGVPVGALPPGEEERTLTLDVSLTSRLSRSVAGSLGAYVRNVRGVEIEDRAALPVPLGAPPRWVATLAPPQSGRVASLTAELDARPLPFLTLRSYYEHRRPFGADERLEEAWGSVPRHRARQTATVTVPGGVGFHAALTWRSASTWTVLPPGAIGSAERRRVGGFALLNLTGQKSFWNGRLVTTATLDNVLDETVRYHPYDDPTGFGVYVQAELRLGDLGGGP